MNYANTIERVYEYVENDEVEKAVMACLRLARHLEDHMNATIFLRELNPSKDQFARVFYEDTSKLKEEEQEYLWKRSLDIWIEGRTMEFTQHNNKDNNVFVHGIGEIEPEINQLERTIQDLTVPAGLHPLDAAARTDRYASIRQDFRLRINTLQTVRASIKTRCWNYAISLEKQLQAQQNTELFLHGIQTEVNNYFKAHCEEVYTKLLKAAQLVASNDPEDKSLLLTEVRRATKAVADHFYPAMPEPVLCADGKPRKLDDEKYLNRLEQFVQEKLSERSSDALLNAELQVLMTFTRRLNDISSKGVHANVSTEEAKQGLVGLYMFLYNLISKLQMQQPAKNEIQAV